MNRDALDQPIRSSDGGNGSGGGGGGNDDGPSESSDVSRVRSTATITSDCNYHKMKRKSR